ncbi:MAG: hypothetical protein IT379_33105 [Deltaproteobacteria bacterium]|nr:hypothetical protein [Deltaproteobacteria bacterium]
MSNAVTFTSLRGDFAARLFYDGDGFVRRHDSVLWPHLAGVLERLTVDAIRRVLAAGSVILPEGLTVVPSSAEHKIYALSQFIGACESILGAAHLIRGGYPDEAATLARRAYETAAGGLYVVDKPSSYDSIRRTQRAPSIGKVVEHVAARSRQHGDPQGLRAAYQAFSNQAHSGPGVRLVSNFLELDRVRLGPRLATEDFAPFERGLAALSLATDALGFIAALAFAGELQTLDSSGPTSSGTPPPAGAGET